MLKRLLLVVALCLLAIPAFGLQPGSQPIEAPSGGWTYSGLTDADEATTAAYPFNLIDRGAQRGRTLIRGHLPEEMRAIPGDQEDQGTKGARHRAPTLAVNGNPLLLYSDAQGVFARPYAFGPGSNSIELLDADGHSVQRLQLYEANTSRSRAQMRVILAWDDPQAQVDLHVLTPDGQHAFWGRPTLTGGGGLDVDSVDGAGPQMFTITAAQRGLYQFYVNYWGNFAASGYHFNEQTRQKPIITCRITMILDENTPDERRESFVIPLRKIGELTHIRSLIL
ncbi:MAG: DUF2135 domain-containing protein [Desulfobulbus sp.]|nr:DUF2135 domain-containing protein [Desulfobulbus sp.]